MGEGVAILRKTAVCLVPRQQVSRSSDQAPRGKAQGDLNVVIKTGRRQRLVGPTFEPSAQSDGAHSLVSTDSLKKCSPLNKIILHLCALVNGDEVVFYVIGSHKTC